MNLEVWWRAPIDEATGYEIRLGCRQNLVKDAKNMEGWYSVSERCPACGGVPPYCKICEIDEGERCIDEYLSREEFVKKYGHYSIVPDTGWNNIL